MVLNELATLLKIMENSPTLMFMIIHSAQDFLLLPSISFVVGRMQIVRLH